MKTLASMTLGLTIVAGAAGSAFADSNSDKMHVKKLIMNGSGCKSGTADVIVAPDESSFTVLYSDFLAQIGPGVDLTESRKNCQLNILMHVPQGLTYAIASVDYRGYAELAPGAVGLQKASYYFQGQAPTASTERTFEGPMDDHWVIHEEVDTAGLVFAPCGADRALNINTQLRLNKGTSDENSSSFLSASSTAVDPANGFAQLFNIVWRPCSRGK